MDSILVTFFKHNTWANLYLLNVCASLTDEQLDSGADGTYGTIRATLMHLITAEELYLTLLTNAYDDAAPRPSRDFSTIPELRERLRRSGEGLVEVAAREEPGRVLRGIRRGEPYAVPAVVVLLQAINHATEHRSHVMTILSTLGTEPPELDGWTYGDELERC